MVWDHSAKMELAQNIGRRVGAQSGMSVLFGCVTGSVAREDDTDRSDLDTMFLTQDKIRLPNMSPDGYREFVYRGLKTQIEFRTKEEALEILRNTGPYWPFQVKDFLEPQVIFGRPEAVAETTGEFRRLLENLPDAAFRKGAGHALMWAHASLAKVRNAHEDGDRPRAIQAAVGLAADVAAFVALLNRRYYSYADIRQLEEARAFSVVPSNYLILLKRLYLEKDAGGVLAAAEDIWEACDTLAKRLGIRLDEHEDLKSVGL